MEKKDARDEGSNSLFNERGIGRRALIKSTSAMTAAAMLPSLFKKTSDAEAEATPDSNTFVYVGNLATKPRSWDAVPGGRGIGIFRYDKATGGLELVKSGVMDKLFIGAKFLKPARASASRVHE